MKWLSALGIYLLSALLFFGGLTAVESYLKYDDDSPIEPTPHRPPYIRPDHPYHDEHWIDAEINVKDDPEPLGLNVVEVYFDGKQLPITPPTPEGDRGVFHLQIKPGKHKIEWEVEALQYAWPKFQKLTETIDISEKHQSVHITIEGKKVYKD